MSKDREGLWTVECGGTCIGVWDHFDRAKMDAIDYMLNSGTYADRAFIEGPYSINRVVHAREQHVVKL